MKINEHIGIRQPHPSQILYTDRISAISTPSILLVPYSAHHVPTYHTWMADPELQAATASEPLSLSEEYAMQASWRNDADKLTFIACLPSASAHAGSVKIQPQVDDGPERMIGDINLFLFRLEDEDDETSDSAASSKQEPIIGEIELMIARKDLRRQGYGRKALLSFIDYVLANWSAICAEFAPQDQHVGPALFRVKIQESNIASTKLFESIGFKRIKEEANYFGELELRWQAAEGQSRQLRECKGWEEGRTCEYP